MSAAISAQDQLAELLAQAMPDRILAFKFSPDIQERIEELVNRKKENNLDHQELHELEVYLAYDLLIGLAKARAKKIAA